MIASRRPRGPGRLAHLGVLYGSHDELVAALSPHVTTAVAAGGPVTAMVDRHVRRAMRTSHDAQAAHVVFTAPHRPAELGAPFWHPPVVPTAPGHRALLIAQYAPAPVHGHDVAARESVIDVLLRDLPVTVVCACPRDADRAVVEAFRASHPYLLLGPDTLENPRYRPPPDRCPVPVASWGGRHALRVLFRHVTDLHQVRRRAASLAVHAALDGEVVDIVALAAHEAAVLALGAHEQLEPVVDSGHVSALDGWIGEGRVAIEVHGPGLDAGRARHDAGLVGPPTLTAAENLRVVRTFCDPSPVMVTSDARSVRITATGALDAVRG